MFGGHVRPHLVLDNKYECIDSISTSLYLSSELIGVPFDALLKKPLHFENEELEKQKKISLFTKEF